MDDKTRFQQLIGIKTKEDRVPMISENFMNMKDETKDIPKEEVCDDEELDIDFEDDDEL
jgi:hypothetical protein